MFNSITSMQFCSFPINCCSEDNAVLSVKTFYGKRKKQCAKWKMKSTCAAEERSATELDQNSDHDQPTCGASVADLHHINEDDPPTLDMSVVEVEEVNISFYLSDTDVVNDQVDFDTGVLVGIYSTLSEVLDQLAKERTFSFDINNNTHSHESPQLPPESPQPSVSVSPQLLPESPPPPVSHQLPIESPQPSVSVSPQLPPPQSSDSDTDVGYYEQEIPKVKIKVRRKIRDDNTWQRTISKVNRNKGESYISSCGKRMPRKKMGTGCNNCRLKCHEKIDCKTRKSIFKSYWATGNLNQQRQFIVDHMHRTVTARKTTQESSRRQLSYTYNLKKGDSEYKVCKNFFLSTLGIKEDVVYGAWDKRCQTGVVKQDMRGKHKNHKQLSHNTKKVIRRHISSFKTVESHYCRQSTDRQYLPSELSVSKMYRMYKEYCAKKGEIPAKEAAYRKIFNREFNLHFFVPKKDQCDFCTEYQNTAKKSTILSAKYRKHCQQKLLARRTKKEAKRIARQDGTYVAACFDLQRVLSCPHGEVSSYYYHRKLSLYNLSAYSLGTGDAYCYLWTEADARRGANEVGSCLLRFIRKQVKRGAKVFHFFSDNCGGRNRNRIIASMWWYAIKKFPSITRITHTFLEVGHTQNENDSVHSCIERASRHVAIFTPDQWSGVISSARHHNPYKVYHMEREDFLDFKMLSTGVRNFAVTEEGQQLKWGELRSMEFRTDQRNTMYIKHLHQEEFQTVELMRRQRTAKIAPPLKLKQIRTDRPLLSAAKYRDLQKLCKKKLIPRRHHTYFLTLPHEEEESGQVQGSASVSARQSQEPRVKPVQESLSSAKCQFKNVSLTEMIRAVTEVTLSVRHEHQ